MAIVLNGSTGITTPGQTITGDIIIADKILHSGDSDTTIRFPAANTVTISTAGSERLRIDSGGNVGIGTTPTTLLNLYGATAAQLLINGDTTAIVTIARATTDAVGPALNFRKRRGTTASPLAVASSDVIGNSNYSAYDGSALRATSQIQGNVETFTGVDNVSGFLNFSTRPSGAAAALTERMRISSAGYVTTPYQPAFIAAGLASQTIYTANQVIVFNTAPLNIGSGYSTSTGKFTAPVAGTYAFAYQVYLNPGGTNAPIAFYKNGTMEIFFLQNVAINGIGLSTIISLAASDYVEVRVRNTVGATATVYNGTDHTQFTGYLIG